MIAFLSGILESLSADTAVIDVGGVGYEVKIPTEVSGNLSSAGTGSQVKLYTFMYLREDQAALYGFSTRDDLSLFRQLITVSGVGPKGGLSLLSVLSADDLRFAVVTGDARTLSRAPGIGKKTAERIILDLRDKISSAYAPAGTDLVPGPEAVGAPGPAGGAATPVSDAVEALTALGYSRAEAVRAVKRCRETEDTEAILREALRYL